MSDDTPATPRATPAWWDARLALVLVVALAVALLAQGQMTGDSFAPLIDSEAYLLQALRLADGADIVEGVYFQAPLYPLLLGSVFAVSGVPGSTIAERFEDLPPETRRRALSVGRGLGVLLGCLAVALVYRAGRVLFDQRTALVAGLAMALHGPALFYQGHLLKVSLSLVFLPWAALAVTRAVRRGAPRAWIWVGLALGLGGLVRGNMHLLGLLAGVVLLLHGLRRRALAEALPRVAWLAAGALLALTPVIVRNSLVAGRPVLSTAAGGTAFYLCNHAGNDTGLVEHLASNRQIPRYEFDDWRQRAEAAEGRSLTPAEISQHWMDRALEDIAADPGRWLWVELRKLGLLFSRYEAPDNTLVALGEEQSWLLAWTPSRHGVLVPLGLAGLALMALLRRGALPSDPGARAGRHAWLIALVGYAATLLLFNMTSRFRMPVTPLLIVPAAFAVTRLPAVVSGAAGGRARLVAGLGLLLGLGLTLVSEGPLGPLDARELAGHRLARFKNRAQLALGRGDVEAARGDIERALEEGSAAGLGSPDLFVLAAGLDRAEAAAAGIEGRGEDAARLRGRAVVATRQALELNPTHGPGQRMAGLLLYDEGAWADAVAAFGRALEAVPLDREARQYLVLSLLAAGQAERAAREARPLVDERPEDDDGHGLLALALLRAGRSEEARQALEAYDRFASIREAGGLLRRFPDQPEFEALRP